MKSLSATALFALAVITECFGAHDRGSRQRSGPIRSVPVAANIKREVDFDCPEEFGYYPHPTDCTLYYVCVFGGALLESCTGGLMYSHELQTCDWPRNVGCDATGAVVADDLERINEREPPPPPPPRRNPPPPPRAQPNPIITSRGQPKFNRQEYEQQQQLYAEVDDLPPVEELENDRQQRVYRGQPSTIGQVQKDRDGYGSQSVSSGRTLNSNIIPSSINQNSKIGSFSFGTQVDDRRTATVTPAPQTYRSDRHDLTDSSDRPKDFSTDIYEVNDIESNILTRKKRNVEEPIANISKVPDEIAKRNDYDEVMEYIEYDDELPNHDQSDEEILEDSERGKRQIRFYVKNDFKTPQKNRVHVKPIKLINLQQYNYNPNLQIQRQPTYNGQYFNHGQSQKPYIINNNQFSQPNTFSTFQLENSQPLRPFKASLPDHSNQKNIQMGGTSQVITKSPPISLLNSNQNPFSALSGGYYNNVKGNNNGLQGKIVSSTKQPVSFPDSFQISSAIVTEKPVFTTSSSPNKFPENQYKNTKQVIKIPNKQIVPEYDEEDEKTSSEENENSSKEENKHSSYNFQPIDSNLPYDYTHPSNKFANIENPFASPNFNFDDFLAKLQKDHYAATGQTIQKANLKKNLPPNVKNNAPVQVTTASYNDNELRSTSYNGISTPKPFTMPIELNNMRNVEANSFQLQNQPKHQLQQARLQNYQSQQIPSGQYTYDVSASKDAKIPLETLLPKLKPPNFKDDRQLAITYKFNQPNDSFNFRQPSQQSQTPNPYTITIGTGSPKYHSTIRNNKINTQYSNLFSSNKPYISSTAHPITFYAHSSPKPVSTIANEQLSALQNFWNNPSHDFSVSTPSMYGQNAVTEVPRQSTSSSPPKRKPIPKPSPEMNDYYYDEDDDQYYYEPIVKPKYMPSSEIKPLRPLMAQNYQEYVDTYDQNRGSYTKSHHSTEKPDKYNPYKQESATKNHNDVSVVTKVPYKQQNKNISGKIPVPVMVDFGSSNSIFMQPEVSSYRIVHNNLRNRTVHIRKPIRAENNPNTLRPPKYLNQTTLRPYTVRHRLAKPTEKGISLDDEENKQNRGTIRHHNIVAQLKHTTTHDNFKQETRVTKTNHDDKTNSLEPTESITPSSYSASPRPKMLYNGSQAYTPDQYDPYYAVYDEDGELYKDTDYVQQYNTASLRPAVQQTYRGTPPPARRPVETYTPRPSLDDYDDTLIQGQISNQNQYQTPVRQPSRGEGNELGYDHIPSSVRTTVFEAASLRTTPSTTSTSTTTTTTTTTRRPTTAPYIEAKTPSRQTLRSSTDEKHNSVPDPIENQNSYDKPTSLTPTISPVINFSSLAKPFEKTDNSHRLSLPSTEDLPTRVLPSRVTNKKANIPINTVQIVPTQSHKKMFSLTTGFSIRRNVDNSKNPYTLTLISKPLESSSNSKIKSFRINNDTKKHSIHRIQYEASSTTHFPETKHTTELGYKDEDSSVLSRNNFRSEIIEDEDVSIYLKPPTESSTIKPRTRSSTIPTTDGTKYYLKTVLKRPVPLNTDSDYPTESNIQNEDPIEIDSQKYEYEESDTSNIEKPNNWKVLEYNDKYNEPFISYKSLDENNENEKDTLTNYELDLGATSTVSSISTTTPTTSFPSTTPLQNTISSMKSAARKPSYYLYHVEDDAVAEQTTEVFSNKVKNVIKSFIDNLSSSSVSNLAEHSSSSVSPDLDEKVVNIGFLKKKQYFTSEKPLRSNIKHVKIITEPNIIRFMTPTVETITFMGPNVNNKYIFTSSAKTTTSSITELPILVSKTETDLSQNISTFDDTLSKENAKSKFSSFLKGKSDIENSQIYQKIAKDIPNISETTQYNKPNYIIDTTPIKSEDVTTSTESDDQRQINDYISEFVSTTSTTKSTTTLKTEIETKPTTKSISFPTRASRINPAIKLAAAKIGGGRRSYQSSSNCSSDNSLQANTKCNEIKYQRPSSTRGRGSAHYSTSGASSDSPQQAPNRGTPPTRSRPTLKPSTAIVSKVSEVDIYINPPNRPASVYPQPTPDKTAAKCRKDVCLLPDCFCGAKDIPGELPVDTIPQIVLLTFDDSVNDLNKGLYSDLFEKGRVNPNGCPISATFYVSHEWTDYSQVQNLYSAGHEMASHTVSHSFGEQFSQKKWNREVGGQREILAAYGGVKIEDVRGMRAPFLSVGGNKMFKMLYDSNFTYDSSLPVYENKPPSWPYTLDYKLFHDCMIPPCPTKSYPGVWEVPMVMWQDLNGGRCSMGDACANPPDSEGVYKMILKNFDRHYTSNRAPFGLFYHAAWFTQPHHKEGFIKFLDFINKMNDVWIITNWQAIQWVRDPTPISRLNNFQPFQCNYQDRPKKCNNPKVCNLWHKSGVRYMRTCQPCPEIYPWTGKTGIRSSRIDHDIDE